MSDLLLDALSIALFLQCIAGWIDGRRIGRMEKRLASLDNSDEAGFKRGWIAGIDYEKNHKDGV